MDLLQAQRGLTDSITISSIRSGRVVWTGDMPLSFKGQACVGDATRFILEGLKDLYHTWNGPLLLKLAEWEMGSHCIDMTTGIES